MLAAAAQQGGLAVEAEGGAAKGGDCEREEGECRWLTCRRVGARVGACGVPFPCSTPSSRLTDAGRDAGEGGEVRHGDVYWPERRKRFREKCEQPSQIFGAAFFFCLGAGFCRTPMDVHHRLRRDPTWHKDGCNLCGVVRCVDGGGRAAVRFCAHPFAGSGCATGPPFLAAWRTKKQTKA